MSTATQTQTAASSFGRRRFPHLGLSPPKAVVNIIASRRHASTADLNATNTTTGDSGESSSGEPHPGGAAPKQRRTVSAPSMNDKSDGDSDPEENNAAGTATAASPPQVSKTSTSTSSSGGFHHHLTFPHVAKIFVKLRRVQKKVKAHHIDSSSGDEPQTHSSLLNAYGGLVPEVMRKLARLEIQEEFVCLDGVDVEKLLRASRLALLEHASPLLANVLVDEQWTSSICGPKHRSDGSFRVHIRYAATAATLSPTPSAPSNASSEPSSSPSSSSNPSSASPSPSATTDANTNAEGNKSEKTDKTDQKNTSERRERRDSSRRDSRQPIALEKASGVPGLMTIASRETVALSVVSLFEEVRIATQS